MYTDKITLFNRFSTDDGDIWLAKVLDGVNLITDKAAINAKYGSDSQDTAKLHIKYTLSEVGVIMIGSMPYYEPKQWQQLTQETAAQIITFKSGQKFDFFMRGEYTGDKVVIDDDYKKGFYDYINAKYDGVYCISSVSNPYKAIKHFEIMGK